MQEEDLVPGSLSRDSIPSTTDWLFSSGSTALSASGTNKTRTLSVDSQLSYFDPHDYWSSRSQFTLSFLMAPFRTSPTGSSLSSSAALLASSPRRNRALTQLSAYFERNGMPPAPSPLSQSPLSHSFLASSSPPQGHLSAPLAPSPQPSFTPHNGFSAQFVRLLLDISSSTNLLISARHGRYCCCFCGSTIQTYLVASSRQAIARAEQLQGAIAPTDKCIVTTTTSGLMIVLLTYPLA